MPWKPADAADHVQGLTAHQRVVWSRVANNSLASCRADGGSQDECEGTAIRQANSVAQRAPKKSVEMDGDGSLEILGVPFGGPFPGGKDSDGEYFTDRTELCLDWFPERRPLLFDHGMDAGTDVSPIGTVDVGSARKSDAGWWFRAQLDRSHQYWKQMAALIEEDAIFASSSALPWLVKRHDDGEIVRWPWVELSLTATPANFYAVVQPADAEKHYKSAGLPEPNLSETVKRAKYMAPAGSYEALTEDLREAFQMARNAGKDVYTSVVATYSDHFIAAMYGQNVGEEASYLSVPYGRDADGKITLGTPTEVEAQTSYVAAVKSRRHLSRHQVEAVITTLQALLGDDDDSETALDAIASASTDTASKTNENDGPITVAVATAKFAADLDAFITSVGQSPDEDISAARTELGALVKRLGMAPLDLRSVLQRAETVGDLNPREQARVFRHLADLHGTASHATATMPSGGN